MRRLFLAALAVLLSLLAGCQRLNFEKEATLDAKNDPLLFSIEGAQSESKINIKVDSDKPVNVWVILEDDKETALTEVLNKKRPARAHAGEENKEKIELDTTIPAKKSIDVVVSQAKGTSGKAKVTLTIKGK